jgi:hypothetical protein
MKLFNKKKETAMVPIEDCPVVVSVPDIKDYLVKEYERVNALVDENKRLEKALELSREIKLKYDAALVTLDEYSKRLSNADYEIAREKQKTASAREEANILRDQLNSFKIKLNDAALTKEQMRDEIIAFFKDDLIEKIMCAKGNLSKQRAIDIIRGEKDAEN